jgi:hypothetical protein
MNDQCLDHFNGRSDNRIQCGWAICVSCNRGLEKDRSGGRAAFDLFHQRREQLDERPHQIELLT